QVAENLADVDFGAARRRAIVVGKVEVSDAAIECGVNHSSLVVGRAVAAEVLPTTERDRRELQAPTAAAAVVHSSSVTVGVRSVRLHDLSLDAAAERGNDCAKVIRKAGKQEEFKLFLHSCLPHFISLVAAFDFICKERMLCLCNPRCLAGCHSCANRMLCCSKSSPTPTGTGRVSSSQTGLRSAAIRGRSSSACSAR